MPVGECGCAQSMHVPASTHGQAGSTGVPVHAEVHTVQCALHAQLRLSSCSVLLHAHLVLLCVEFCA